MWKTIGPHSVYMLETMEEDSLEPLFSDVWTGSRVWMASELLSETVLTLTTPRTVLELGAGCGLCSMIASKHWPSAKIIATDQSNVLSILQKNIEHDLNTIDNIITMAYTWGKDTSPLLSAVALEGYFDIILISDCINPIYGKSSWTSLAISLQTLSSRSTTIYISYTHRGDDAAWIDFTDCCTLHFEMRCLEEKSVRGNNRISVFKFTLKKSPNA